MPDYLLVWVDYAQEQFLSLDPDVRDRLSERLRLLAADPKVDARYDAGTDRWGADFDKGLPRPTSAAGGSGLVVYIVNDSHRRVVILRVVHLS